MITFILCLDCEQSLFCSKIREEKVAEHESHASGEAARSARGRRRAKRETAMVSYNDCEARHSGDGVILLVHDDAHLSAIFISDIGLIITIYAKHNWSFVNPTNSGRQQSTTYSYCTCFKLYIDDLNFFRGLIFADKLIFERFVLFVYVLRKHNFTAWVSCSRPQTRNRLQLSNIPQSFETKIYSAGKSLTEI